MRGVRASGPVRRRRSAEKKRATLRARGPSSAPRRPIEDVALVRELRLGMALVRERHSAVIDFAGFECLAGADGILGQDLPRWFVVLDGRPARAISSSCSTRARTSCAFRPRRSKHSVSRSCAPRPCLDTHSDVVPFPGASDIHEMNPESGIVAKNAVECLPPESMRPRNPARLRLGLASGANRTSRAA